MDYIILLSHGDQVFIRVDRLGGKSIMRPASLRSTASPFMKRKDKGGSKKLELDYDHLEESHNHRLASDLNLAALTRLRRELREAEAMGAYSKAKKLRREINKQLEQGLYIQGTWCPGCNNYLHRCQCKSLNQLTMTRKEVKKEAEAQKRMTAIAQRITSN